jgi:hypothetical protein
MLYYSPTFLLLSIEDMFSMLLIRAPYFFWHRMDSATYPNVTKCWSTEDSFLTDVNAMKICRCISKYILNVIEGDLAPKMYLNPLEISSPVGFNFPFKNQKRKNFCAHMLQKITLNISNIL